ncbi:MAG: glycosyltransferase 87 family protein [Thermodesulfobacteriota bacterium]
MPELRALPRTRALDVPGHSFHPPQMRATSHGSLARLALAAILVLGAGLRVWNAATAFVFSDERHAVSDAFALASLPAGDALRFLRYHPRDHLRLDPATGALAPWSDWGKDARLGHPCLFDYVAGVVIRLVRPGWPEPALLLGRLVNAAADTVAVGLLPRLVGQLGGGTACGLLAALLYAVFPPAVTYGSIGNFDPFLAPLAVLLAITLLDPRPGLGPWVRAGIVTGLLAAAKQTGLLAMVLVPIARSGQRGWSRGMLAWGVTSLVVLACFTSPTAYLDGLLHPSHEVGRVRVYGASKIAHQLSLLYDPASYFYLSFSWHGAPLAPLMARSHYVLTPAYLALFAIGAAAALAGRRARELFVLWGPAVLLLVAVDSSLFMWRYQLAYPLLCAGAAYELVRLGRKAGVAAGLAALALGASVLLPQRAGRNGALDLGSLLLMNPQVPQPQGRFRIVCRPAWSFERRLWLPAGEYDVAVRTTGPLPRLVLDGRPVDLGPRPVRVELTGRLHQLRLSCSAETTVRAIVLRRHVDEA